MMPEFFDRAMVRHDSGVEQTLARCAKLAHAYILFDWICTNTVFA